MQDTDVREALRSQVTRFTEAFGRNDLQAVVELFAPDAVYVEYNGREHHGREAIGSAFKPLFRGDFGHVVFHETNLVIDPSTSTVVLQWLCRHEIKGDVALSRSIRLRQSFYRMVYGADFGWHGLDVFRFRNGLVSAKHTYAKTRLPQAVRSPVIPNGGEGARHDRVRLGV